MSFRETKVIENRRSITKRSNKMSFINCSVKYEKKSHLFASNQKNYDDGMSNRYQSLQRRSDRIGGEEKIQCECNDDN